MKGLSTQQIRNIALISHMGAGKTSLAEGLLFTSGAISRLGKVEDGNTVSDFDSEEIRRRCSLQATPLFLFWKEHKINLIDTPGLLDFIGEIQSALRAVEGAFMLVSAVSGVEVGTELYWQNLEKRNIPRGFFINKLDKENTDFHKTLSEITEAFGKSVIPVHLPIGKEGNFKGVVDLLKLKALYFQEQTGNFEEKEIPEELKGEADSLREKLLEAVTESDDLLLEKYLEGQEISEEELKNGLRKAIKEGKVFPVLAGSATRNQGSAALLDFICDYFPSPLEVEEVKAIDPRTQNEISLKVDPQGPLAALVWKTMADPYVGKINVLKVLSGTLRPDTKIWNSTKEVEEKIAQPFFIRGKTQEGAQEVIAGDIGAVSKLAETKTGDSLCLKDQPLVLPPIEYPKPVLSASVKPKSKGDEEKISNALARMMEEDPTIDVYRDTEVGQTILSGLGQSHLEATVERMKRKFGVDVILEPPKVAYKETIRATVKSEGKYKKQTGGHGQYGHCFLEISPLERGKGFEFENRIVGGVIPKQYIPAVEKGVREAMEKGVLAGYPVIDVKVAVYDGSYHPVDSSELAFKIASSMAFKKGVAEAKPVLLEPIMSVEVRVPEAYMGDVISDLNSKRGRILGMEAVGRTQVIKAQVPLAEMLTYANDLTSITQGRGYYTMEFSHYEEVPTQIAEGIIEKAQKEKEEEKE
ncbi:MAG: elongation factor G [Caldiserica bacterium]|jgi:elongation factor G|nr:elongation factor G [Caldisericota bacterium]MDH7562199.1 elongation factor G [Caldisericota bacterium]